MPQLFPPQPIKHPLDQRTNTLQRRALDFAPRFRVIHERADASGPQLLAAYNGDRISLWVKAPKLNTAVIYLGDQSILGLLSTPITGGWLADHSWDLEPGESLIIADTMGAVYAVAQQGQGDQLLKWLELSDPGPRTQ